MAGRVWTERSGARAVLWIDNPSKRNAVDIAMLEQLAGEARALAGDAQVRLVVLRGAGGVFGAGADFDGFAAADQAGFAERFAGLERAMDGAIAALEALRQPLVAVLEGACWGGSVQLALAADMRLAATDLKLAIPAASLGILYPLAALDRLVALAGPARAKLLLLAGRTLAASEALGAGLVDAQLGRDEIGRWLDGAEVAIAGAPAATVELYKRALDHLAAGRPKEALAAEHAANNASAETSRRIAAVLAKRRAKG
jgi:enoyl-CoA hydratase/carnithine racemase